MGRHYRLVSGVPAQGSSYVAADETVATGAFKYTGQPWVNPANDLFAGVQTTRWNRSRLIRCANWTPRSITLLAQAIPGGEGHIGIVVDGSLFSTLTLSTASAVPQWQTVNGLPAGGKTVDLLEDFQDRVTQLDTGLDGVCAGTYVLGVNVPHGVQPPAALTADNVIVAFGDSHVDGLADVPCSFNGWCGQLRYSAMSHGWLLGYAGAGSSTLCGDGITHTQTAQTISGLWSQMGAKPGGKWFLMLRRPNDYAYWSFVGSIHSPPATYGSTYLAGVLDDLHVSDPGYHAILIKHIPQGPSWGANGGGFTLDNYSDEYDTIAATRPWVTVKSSAPFGLVLPTDYFEPAPGEVHNVQTGHNKIAPVVKTYFPF